MRLSKPHTSRRGRTVAITVSCALLVAGAAGGAYALANPVTVEQPATVEIPTGAVEFGDLVGTKRVNGSLVYADIRPLLSDLGGTLTDIAAQDAIVERGGVLYRLDDTPIVLMIGALPAWRSFEEGMSDGRDVTQLEQNLKDLGFFAGEPDEKFTAATARAITAWQRAAGLAETGAIELGRVMFAPTSVRIAALSAAVGDRLAPGGEVGQISGLEKIVAIDVLTGDQALAVVGTQVSVSLPGGVTTTGTITAVGAAYDKQTANGTTRVLPVTIVVDDPSVAAAAQEGPAGVDLISQTRTGVLSVPLDALIAIGPRDYAVQVVADDGTLRTVPVQTALFAVGRVEVTGDLSSGDRVVVTAP